MSSAEASWSELGLDPGPHTARDLWDAHCTTASDNLKLNFPAHGCALYAVSPPTDR